MRLGSPEHALCTVLRRAHATAPHDGLADAALAHGVLGGAGQPRRQRAAGGLPCAWRPALLLTRALALASSAAAAAAPAAARRPGAAWRAAARASPRGAGQAKQGAVRRQPGRGAAPWHSERCGEACVSPALTLGAARDSGAAVGHLLARPLGAGGAVGRGRAIVWQGVQAAALAPRGGRAEQQAPPRRRGSKTGAGSGRRRVLTPRARARRRLAGAAGVRVPVPAGHGPQVQPLGLLRELPPGGRARERRGQVDRARELAPLQQPRGAAHGRRAPGLLQPRLGGLCAGGHHRRRAPGACWRPPLPR